MSGGHFDYKDYLLEEWADDIEEVIRANEEKNEWGYSRNYSKETITKLKETVEAARRVRKMLHRVDWLLSDDDGEDSFHKRWEEDGI